jgi:hypothetical protein
MRSHARLIRGLLRLYPAAWRREYGAELAEVLASRPLTLRTCANVAWSALRQQKRDAPPGTLVGLAFMLLLAWTIVSNVWVLGPGNRTGGYTTSVLRDSSITFPPVLAWPFTAEPYILILLACGCWSQLRRGRSLAQCGVAAVRLCAIAGLPIVLLGLLIVVGVIDFRIVGPNAPAHGPASSLAYAHFTTHTRAPSPWLVMAAPLFRLPEAWLWGMAGGALGRAVNRRRRSRVVVS